MKNLKQQILELREQGMSYKMIEKQLSCSRGSISYHCSKLATNADIKERNLKAKNTTSKYFEKLDSATMILFLKLMKANISRKHISIVLNIPYNEIINYGIRYNLKRKELKLQGYDKVKEHRRHKKILFLAYKGMECSCCGYNTCNRALHFHHLDPSTKDFSISTNANNSFERVLAEIDKCVLLCANCHAELHERLAADCALPDLAIAQ